MTDLLKRLFSDGGTAFRAFIRALVVVFTAFVLTLDAAQVGAIQLLTEAFIALMVRVVPPPEGSQ